jgi:hypothetical protein
MSRPLTSADRVACPHGHALQPAPTSRLRVDGFTCFVAGVRFEVTTCREDPPCASGLFDGDGALTEGGWSIVLDEAYGATYDAQDEYLGDISVELRGSDDAITLG